MREVGTLLSSSDPVQRASSGLITKEPIKVWTHGNAENPIDVCH